MNKNKIWKKEELNQINLFNLCMEVQRDERKE